MYQYRMKSFFRKSNREIRKAFSKGAQRNTLRKMSNTYQESIPAVKMASEVAGNLAPAALLIPGYGPAVALGLKGAQGASKAYAVGENKNYGRHKPAVMPRNGIQAPKPAEAQPDVFY